MNNPQSPLSGLSNDEIRCWLKGKDEKTIADALWALREEGSPRYEQVFELFTEGATSDKVAQVALLIKGKMK